MFNFARQGFANPFFPSMGASFQPGGALCAGWHPTAIGPGGQIGGFVPTPYGVPVSTGFGVINPIATQFAPGVVPNINPLAAQLMANWPISSALSNPGVGRFGSYGIDPRFAGGVGGQHGYGYLDPNVAPFGINPTVAGDPIGLQQQLPLVNPFMQQQQQLPIRPLIGTQPGFASQQLTPGFASPLAQWVDPYRAFIEAQLVSQLFANPLQHLQRGYGAVPELSGQGLPFTGQAVGPLVNPFYA